MGKKPPSLFRKSARAALLEEALGTHGMDFLKFALQSIPRILPHSELSRWKVHKTGTTKASNKGETRRSLNLSLHLIINDKEFCLKNEISKKRGVGVGDVKRTMDDNEKDICDRILKKIESTLQGDAANTSNESISAIKAVFDEQIVAAYLSNKHNIKFDLSRLLASIRELAEQSYENKSLTLGCIIDNKRKGNSDDTETFPKQFISRKKIRALSDGFRTAYRLSKTGHLVRFEDLKLEPKDIRNHKDYFYPEWCEYIAHHSVGGNIGICLTRQGDVLIFESASLKFSYRFGQWQYWNHAHIVSLLTNRARAQHVKEKVIGDSIRFLYRAALDVSFRRTGGLIGLIGAKKDIGESVLSGDRIGNRSRENLDEYLDDAITSKSIHEISRRVFVELIGLDGATIVSNTGKLLAYGAVLQPKIKGNISPAEGSRTKAAIGFSHYGLAIKISSDGDITCYDNGKSFLAI